MFFAYVYEGQGGLCKNLLMRLSRSQQRLSPSSILVAIPRHTMFNVFNELGFSHDFCVGYSRQIHDEFTQFLLKNMPFIIILSHKSLKMRLFM
jgi:hypothetical protein